MQIFAVVPLGAGIKYSGVVDDGNFLALLGGDFFGNCREKASNIK